MSDQSYYIEASDAVDIKHELKLLLSLAGPMSLTFVIESLQTTISVALVGRMHSDNSKVLVDAAALSSMYTTISSTAVGLGLTTALDTLCSQAYGSGNLAKMGVTLQSGLLGMALVYIPVFVLNWFCEDILVGLGQDPTVCAYAGRFTLYTTLGLPFYYVHEVLRKQLQAHHIVYPMLLLAVLSNALHIGVGIALINEMGFYGAALARCLSLVAYPFMMALYLWYNPVYKQWSITWSFQVAVGNLREFFAFGLPGLVMMVLEIGAFEALTIFSGLLPDHLISVGANAILMQIVTLFYTLYLGMGVAAGVRIGYMVGANKIAHAKIILKLGYGLFITCTLITTLAQYLLRSELPRAFVHDKEISQRATELIVYILPLHFLDAMNCLSQATLRALGKPALATYVNAAAYYLVGLPLAAAFAMGLHWSSEGLWSGFSASSFCGCCAYAFILQRVNWEQVVEETNKRNAMGEPMIAMH